MTCKNTHHENIYSMNSQNFRIALKIEDVQAYVTYKAFDVIGNGTYRKFVNHAKEKDEQWACKTIASIVAIQTTFKQIQVFVNDLQSACNKRGLYQLCQSVIENNTPPTDQNTVIAECCISGKQKCQCIVLRCKGRGTSSITVQGRFSHFILMLWTVFKMDLVIKTVTRDFIDSLDSGNISRVFSMCFYALRDTPPRR